MNFGDSAINNCQITYFSLRTRETPTFLLPVKNLTLPSCSPTLISHKIKEFWHLATSKGQIAYFFHRACAKWPYFYFLSKIWRHHRVPRFRFPIWCRNFGDSAIDMGQIAYFSLRMRETPIFLLPVKNLTSPSCSPTPISYKLREFWRYVYI